MKKLIDLEDITDKNDIITILEIQGIKCSPRSFQIEMEIKQMLVLPQNNLFEKCILVKSNHSVNPSINNTEYLGKSSEKTQGGDYTSNIENIKPAEKPSPERGTSVGNGILSGDVISSHNIEEPVSELKECEIKDSFSKIKIEEDPKAIEILDIPMNATGLEEVDFSLDEIPVSDQIQIKQRNDVYYKMYQAAKQKAKMARDLALSAYLEAKQIKNKYMLEDSDDSDSDLDEEDFYENLRKLF